MEERIEENTRKELRQRKPNKENSGIRWFVDKRAEVESALELCTTQKKKKELLKLQINF